jgi:hypothetical protein
MMATQNQEKATRSIESILRERGSPLANELSGVQDVRQLSRAIRESIVDELGEEFSEKGLCPDGEPNPYGLEIETLTDACGLAWDADE